MHRYSNLVNFCFGYTLRIENGKRIFVCYSKSSFLNASHIFQDRSILEKNTMRDDA
jgi:hypothetical protein